MSILEVNNVSIQYITGDFKDIGLKEYVVRQLCSKILWLHKGRQIAFGDDVQGICDRYQAMLDGKLQL